MISIEKQFSIIQEQLLQLARKVLERKIGVVEGSLLIAPILFELGLECEEAFETILSVSSVCERFVFGETRKLWSPELLERQDSELCRYENLYRSGVESSCREIINRCSHAGQASQPPQ